MVFRLRFSVFRARRARGVRWQG